MTEVLHALFVAWQHPDTQRFHPVARLAQVQGAECADCFEFTYIDGARLADGFQPFVSFPDLHQVYRSRSLFPMFTNRLLSSSRSDFPEYIAQLGLPNTTTSQFTILSRSGGRRATDTLELFPLPEFEPGIGYRTWFWVHGLRHLPPLVQSHVDTLTLGERLLPKCEPDNPVNPSAIKLLSSVRGYWIGYMPSYLLDEAQTLQQTCEICHISVERVNPLSSPIQQRVLCRLESCWPQGFLPYSSPRYQPLSSEAAVIPRPSMELMH